MHMPSTPQQNNYIANSTEWFITGVNAQESYTTRGNSMQGKKSTYGDSPNRPWSCFRMEIHETFV